LTLADGFHVGIANLDGILKDVADLKLTDDKAIKNELLTRVKNYNYVPPNDDYYYSQALMNEYRKQFGKSK
jgi:hypothetical protein